MKGWLLVLTLVDLLLADILVWCMIVMGLPK
jgi:hypothetical protein